MSKKRKKKSKIVHGRKDLYIDFAIFLVVFLALTFCAPRSVPLGDSGELTTVAAKLGIAHPTGYPTYTVLGFIFSKIPVSTVAFRLAMMSSFFMALAAVLMFNLVKENVRSDYAHWIATSLFLFIPVIWTSAIIPEVYSLHLFLLFGCLYFLLKWGRDFDMGNIYLSLVFFAFGLTNHLTTVLLVPGIVYYLYIKKFKGINYKTWIFGFFIIIIILSVYIYLPVRSLHNPVIDWGNPETLGSLMDHVTGDQYSYMLSPFSFFTNLVIFSYQSFIMLHMSLVLILFGFFALKNVKKVSFILLLTVAATYFIFSLFYTIPDVMVNFAPIYLFFMIVAALGLEYLASRFSRHTWAIFIPVILLFAAINFVFMGQAMYQRNDQTTRLYAEAVFSEIDKGGYVIIPVDEPFASNTMNILNHYAYAEKLRPDLTFINTPLLVNEWYLYQLPEKDLKFEKPVFSDEDVVKITKQDEFAYYKKLLLQKLVQDNPEITFFSVHGTYTRPKVTVYNAE